ncbi:hypothetical protein [Nocardioides bizhenqiangii]|uniref:Uncharacterized protein n=1 Tax=Nocardioides bizhenqiangii TaxID=3095076 RepID=A0ABZ0ZQ64_9ACTN|nr:hypothetical protein [Nocardioides sp. HM61]WQQ26091.1 hypothetical protein SHK19_19265 [Nocardioides sp. HM61]
MNPLARYAAVGVTGVALGWALLPFGVRVDQTVTPDLPVDAGLLVPGYGDEGTYALDYRHHEEVTVRLPVSNDGPLPIRVTDADLDSEPLPLLATVDDNLPLRVGPWGEAQLELTLRFDNCRHYHERSADTWDHLDLAGSVLGREFERELALEYPLALHGQIINNCPDRTLTRGDDVRPR